MEKLRYMAKVTQVVDGRNRIPTQGSLPYSTLWVSYISHESLLYIGLLNTYLVQMQKIRLGLGEVKSFPYWQNLDSKLYPLALDSSRSPMANHV